MLIINLHFFFFYFFLHHILLMLHNRYEHYSFLLKIILTIYRRITYYYKIIRFIFINEYENQYGMLRTDYTMLKPGAIHKANGGYLILQIDDILKKPFSWDAIKRSLKTKEIEIESLRDQQGAVVISSLRPENIPLDILYEDDDLYVINKPSGLVVHPGNGNKNHTLVNGLMNINNNLSEQESIQFLLCPQKKN